MVASDATFMARARLLAERGRGTTSPNPIVGAVVVSTGGVVVGQGAHLVAGGPHAEVAAIEAAGVRTPGATIYVTLEPCCHTGRTGPCVERIVAAGVARVVIATEDPNPRVAGGGVKYLREHGIDVTVGVGREEARRQNAPFFRWITDGRPFVTLKAAVSADGFVGRAGRSLRITGAAADRYFQRQRAEIDALAVGAGTVIADDPLLTARGAFRQRPLVRVLFDWHARIPEGARVFSTLSAGPVIMVVTEAAAAREEGRFERIEARGIEVERRPERSLGPVLTWLGSRPVVWMLVEGGPGLHQAFLDGGFADEIQVAVSPRRLEGGIAVAPGMARPIFGPTGLAARPLGDDRLFEWDVHRID
jgi:diaminohydroxyphosphoribosylaminopyrimidine deaminase / 5-amino-6-(5-phosphoribosylamino)uracil reductase